MLNNPDYIVSAGTDTDTDTDTDTSVLLGCFLDVVNALACIGSAVDLFSIAKRQHEGFALGSVWHGIAAAPIFVWVLSLGVWLVVKGFTASPITARMAAAGRPPAHRDA
ncbi:MAG: hypothetical protein JWP76_2464 [Dactylosporangium sp.]|nr:hypothetical protein [Dactylosporangium sp.]